MKFIFYISITIILFSINPSFIFAQTENSALGDLFDFSNIELPNEVKDLFNTADRVQEGVKNTPIVENLKDQIIRCIGDGGTKRCIDETGIKDVDDLVKNTQGFFSRVNDWFQRTIGISFSEIARAVGNFFVWVLRWIVNFLESILSRV